jgi:hypothetical protein
MRDASAEAVIEALRRDESALAELRELLVATNSVTRDEDPWMTARDAATYLGFTSVHPLHKLTAAALIPFEQAAPHCKLYFKRSEPDRWRSEGGAATSELCRSTRPTGREHAPRTG